MFFAGSKTHAGFEQRFKLFLLIGPKFGANEIVNFDVFLLGLRSDGIPKLLHVIVAIAQNLFDVLSLIGGEVKLALHAIQQFTTLPHRSEAARSRVCLGRWDTA